MTPRHLARAPSASLRPLVRRVWASSGERTLTSSGPELERVLPTGLFHVVLRIEDEPLLLLDDSQNALRQIDPSVVGGARTTSYLKHRVRTVAAVGAVLEPHAANLVLRGPHELANRHTPLGEVWGREAVARLRERLARERALEARLVLLEDALARRIGEASPSSVAVARALQRLVDRSTNVAELAARSGYGARRFGALFREQVGLAPKAFLRVQRFQRAVTLLSQARRRLAELALEAGYADQAHFTRDFAELAGLTPRMYRALAPSSPNHVPVHAAPHSPIADLFKTGSHPRSTVLA